MGPEDESRLETQTLSAAEEEPGLAFTVPGLTILGHPDLRRVGERAALLDLSSGREALLARGEPGFSPPGESAPRPLAVANLSRRPWRLRPTADGGVRLLGGDSPMPLAADGEPVVGERLLSAAEVTRGVVLLLARRVVLLLHRFHPAFPPDLPRYGLVGESDRWLDVCRQISQVADLDVPVLLRGESGTGKELVAEALHRTGRRRERPFLALNLGALPPSLAAAELFGTARGAFTGAEQARRGYFRRAHGGTLFLDEIGETPPDVQPLLLRVLENGEIQTPGNEEPMRVDVRILAATDADLEQAVAAGHFRGPLLHRLGGSEIRLPALRERRDDIGRLLLHFLRQELAVVGEEHRLADPGPQGKPWLPAPWVARVAAAAWPGNVRQLRNIVRQLVIASRGAAEARIAAVERLMDEAGHRGADEEHAPRRPRVRTVYRSPQEISEEELLAALAANRWRPGPTARQLDISRPSLYVLLDTFSSTRKAVDLTREEILAARERCAGRLRDTAALLRVSESGLKRRIKQLGLPP
ncbi:MAG TPA: sigma 54-interacting transcriptional regulator [Thermoanaerobaculia bacterium]|nr:sigma 54-interacting transcriptional regulator [Thermoanaerobaculia bacterium]